MSETTLHTDTQTFRDAWLLGHEITPNLEKALSADQIAHYRKHKKELVPAIQRGFLLPGEIRLPAVPVETAGYPIEETDCFLWLGHMEQFAEMWFGTKVTLRDMFPLPARLPWKQILPIFDPAGLTNREMVDKALKAQNLSVYEYTAVEKFTDETVEASRLYLAERTPPPTAGTMGLPPKFAKQWFAGRQTVPLHLRGYGIGTGLLYQVEQKFLDPEAKTVTWFPENIYLPGGNVACSCYDPGRREVGFNRCGAGCEDAGCGFREAIALSLKP